MQRRDHVEHAASMFRNVPDFLRDGTTDEPKAEQKMCATPGDR
jgi:hypothetical protein